VKKSIVLTDCLKVKIEISTIN